MGNENPPFQQPGHPFHAPTPAPGEAAPPSYNAAGQQPLSAPQQPGAVYQQYPPSHPVQQGPYQSPSQQFQAGGGFISPQQTGYAVAPGAFPIQNQHYPQHPQQQQPVYMMPSGQPGGQPVYVMAGAPHAAQQPVYVVQDSKAGAPQAMHTTTIIQAKGSSGAGTAAAAGAAGAAVLKWNKLREMVKNEEDGEEGEGREGTQDEDKLSDWKEKPEI
ncbi:hypothetical protein B0H63DRAFT_455997 [Podospora didyma]|uniref:Uncharacterized protein n=1 Tax=Podospora didyma TaxID=330526 RepID=A0AAE0K0U5_9PEZI|nr:hypothetical protein B0H63DRAFT_455997 [Podospora didyma]